MATARAVMALRPLPSPALGVALLLALLGSAAIQPAYASAGEAAVMNCTCLPDNVGQPSQPGEPAGMSPVCGSDGNTYPDVCGLHCASQAGQRNLAMKHEGPCRRTREAGSREVCEDNCWNKTRVCDSECRDDDDCKANCYIEFEYCTGYCPSFAWNGSASPAAAPSPPRAQAGAGPLEDSVHHDFHQCMIGCHGSCFQCRDGDPHCRKTLPKICERKQRRALHCVCSCVPFLPEGAPLRLVLFPTGTKVATTRFNNATIEGDEELGRCMGDYFAVLERCDGGCVAGDGACRERCVRVTFDNSCKCLNAGAAHAHAGAENAHAGAANAQAGAGNAGAANAHAGAANAHAGAANAHAGTTAARMIAVALLVLTAAAHWLH